MNLTCKSLGGGRKPGNPERTHAIQKKYREITEKWTDTRRKASLFRKTMIQNTQRNPAAHHVSYQRVICLYRLEKFLVKVKGTFFIPWSWVIQGASSKRLREKWKWSWWLLRLLSWSLVDWEGWECAGWGKRRKKGRVLSCNSNDEW